MSSTVFRTEAHALSTTPAIRVGVARTVSAYRRVVRMAATVALTHWPELAPLRAQERQMALEALVHATKLRPVVRYPMFGRVLGKMPSYLRRAALSAALGAVSSYLSNYDNWFANTERERGSRAPRLGLSNVFPSLYGGNMLVVGQPQAVVAAQRAERARKRKEFEASFVGPKRRARARAHKPRETTSNDFASSTPNGNVRIKLLDADADGEWRFSAPLKLRGRLKRLPADGSMKEAPTLIQKGAKVFLSCPVELKQPAYFRNKNIGRVCALDVGINTAACAAIVDSTGTVIARRFLTCGRHNDRRDELAARIARKQAQSNGGEGRRLGSGFCKTLYRRIAGLSLQAARELASQVMAFAREHGAKALVLERLKGFRPKGRGKAQRKRFHRFQHRMLAKYLGFAAEEHGVRVLEVSPGGTSRWAYDGSGKVTRDRDNATQATFTSGKRYNADLNAAYNIAARGLAMLLGVTTKQRAPSGRSPDGAVRMPLVLADIWAYARASAAARLTAARDIIGRSTDCADAPTRAPSGV